MVVSDSIKMDVIDTINFHPLPGSIPYENPRTMRVRAIWNGLNLIDFLCQYHPPTRRQSWVDWVASGDITLDGRIVTIDQVVSAGEKYVHVMHQVVEPDVRANLRILHRDDDMIVVDKPAPLPVHPSGRFNRNTLTSLLRSVYPQDDLRIAHRLDANTTGVVIVCRNSSAATSIQTQFANRQVAKTYFARVHGHIPWEQHTCRLPIGNPADGTPERNTMGCRVTDPDGLASETEFTVFRRLTNGQTILRCVPITGRTNQIRVHLWALDFAIVGDPLYLPSGKLGTRQTLRLDDPPLCLHAHQITLTHPSSKESVTYTSPLPIWADESHPGCR
jgi:RluA family pseudouridine synthase